MPETFNGLVWVDDQAPALNAANLNGVMVGIETIDDRVHAVERGVAPPTDIPYATSVTLTVTQGSLFRCTATGDLTLDNILGGSDGQTVVFVVKASGASRTLAFTGDAESVVIPSGARWVGRFLYDSSDDTWTLY